MRHLVYADDRLLAALGFAAAAWRVYDRDVFIGWSDEQRASRLRRSTWPASSSACGSGSSSWPPASWPWPPASFPAYGRHHRYRPVLLETFVECDRFEGTCYRAANWTCVGETMGRGKRDRLHNRPTTSFKSVWVLPLHAQFLQVLCAPDHPVADRRGRGRS